MGLNRIKLETDIKALLGKMADYDGQGQFTQERAISRFASDLSCAIDAFVRSGEVNTQVTGSCPQGPVSGVGKGGIL